MKNGETNQYKLEDKLKKCIATKHYTLRLLAGYISAPKKVKLYKKLKRVENRIKELEEILIKPLLP